MQSCLFADLTIGQKAHEAVLDPVQGLRLLLSDSVGLNSHPRCDGSHATSLSLNFVSSKPGIKAAKLNSILIRSQ